MIVIDLSFPRRFVQNNYVLSNYIKSKKYYVPAKLFALNVFTFKSCPHSLNDHLYSNSFALLETLKYLNYSKIKAIKELL